VFLDKCVSCILQVIRDQYHVFQMFYLKHCLAFIQYSTTCNLIIECWMLLWWNVIIVMLTVQRNILKFCWGHFKILFESVICYLKKFSSKGLFIQYVFNLTTWKMVKKMFHQRLILKVQRSVDVPFYSRPRSIHFCQNFWILTRDPVVLFFCLPLGTVYRLLSCTILHCHRKRFITLKEIEAVGVLY
jgi:hypothetical protein